MNRNLADNLMNNHISRVIHHKGIHSKDLRNRGIRNKDIHSRGIRNRCLPISRCHMIPTDNHLLRAIPSSPI